MLKNIVIFTLILVLGLLLSGWDHMTGSQSVVVDNGNEIDGEEDGLARKDPADNGKEPTPETPHHEPPFEDEPSDLPMVSIIIDDLGNNREHDMSIANIEADVTLAVLPFRDHTLEVAEFFANRKEMILHLPLEPMSESEFEERMMKVDMTFEEMAGLLNESLEELGSYVEGVNNHKGSRFTSDRRAMGTLLDIISEEDLFFVDSFTIGTSKGYALAKEKGIDTAVRDVFLDNSRDPEDIRNKLLKTVRLAEEQGEAIAIGHSSPETISVLVEEIPKLEDRVNFVPVSELLR